MRNHKSEHQSNSMITEHKLLTSLHKFDRKRIKILEKERILNKTDGGDDSYL